MSTTEKKVAKISIWERIALKLDLSDSDKLKKFFMREKKACERTIKTLKKNKEVLKMNYDNDLSDYKDELEDAILNYEDAKEAIVPENVGNNSDMDEFSDEYWGLLAFKKESIERIEKQIANLETRFEKSIEDIDKEIDENQERINICNEKK